MKYIFWIKAEIIAFLYKWKIRVLNDQVKHIMTLKWVYIEWNILDNLTSGCCEYYEWMEQCMSRPFSMAAAVKL